MSKTPTYWNKAKKYLSAKDKIMSSLIKKYKSPSETVQSSRKVGKITNVLQKVIKDVIGVKSSLSTSGGTSDARFISKHAKETVEFGPLNESAHKINENIKLDDLANLEKIYFSVLKELLL